MSFPSSHLPVKIVLPIVFRSAGLPYAGLCRREITGERENQSAQKIRPNTLQYTHSLPHFEITFNVFLPNLSVHFDHALTCGRLEMTTFHAIGDTTFAQRGAALQADLSRLAASHPVGNVSV